ncbi:hypothetical protein COJ42_16905 [Bacillus cereus]|nr:hypothetical protein CN464_28675 [Bacillus cereus]PFJ75323.1 hypothetical protein COI95_21485 [Bacillus cereus]PFM32128.1 hypothetical protein COJ42_16905 [Bacillus cereus]PFP89039.1 hypothetical protein COK02_17650 [Bacillus cereus]PGN52389.1 hypothetical protein CN966_24905 [Bacillus cereus]
MKFKINLCTLAEQFLGQCQIAGGIYQIKYTLYNVWDELRVRFESRWTLLNHSRTLTCILSVSALLVALHIHYMF